MTHEIRCSKTMFDLKKNQKMVLLHIAKYGPQYGNIISKTRLRLDGLIVEDRSVKPLNGSAVFNAIRHLERAGLIKLEKTEKGMKGSEDRKIYRLTFAGLSLALFMEQDVKVIYDIINKWKYLDPIILGKWDSIIKRVPEEEFGVALFNAMFRRFGYPEFIKSQIRDTIDADTIDNVSFFEWLFKKGPGPEPSGIKLNDISVMDEERTLNIFRDLFFEEVIGRRYLYSEQKWAEAIRDDAQLREWVTSYLERRISILNVEVKFAQDFASRIKQAP